ncbi:hypothetical protein Tco_0270587 [Tanacetum coccineum]
MITRNYLATFTPQKQLTPEQIFWSKDLLKMKAEALKEQTTASRSIKALTVYPPNTPAKLVPRVLPTKIQGIQKALINEIKEMKEVFDQMEAEVDQNVVDKKCDEIDRKNLLLENENLIAECMSKDMFYTSINYVLTVFRFSDMHDAYTAAQKHIAELEAENSNLTHKIQKDDHDEMIKHFSKLEVEHLNLQLKNQHLKESCGNKRSVTSSDAPAFDSVFVIENLKEQLQGKGNIIRELKETVSQLKKKHSKVRWYSTALSQNVKQHYKELYDSIKITRAKTIDKTTSLLTEIENLKAQTKGKTKCLTMYAEKPKVLAPGMYAIDVEPIPPRNRNNREVHLDYLKHLKKSVGTLRDIIEEARAEKRLDSSLASACLYTKHYQELLDYVIGTCLKDFNKRDRKIATAPLIRKKRISFVEPCETSIHNTQTHVEQEKMKKTNEPGIPST